MVSDVERMRVGAGLLGLVALAALAGCTSSQVPSAQSSGSPTVAVRPTAKPSMGTISFCVGTSASHPANSTVLVHFMRGSAVLGAPSIQVPMRISVQASPGPFSVVVDGVAQLTGTTNAKDIASGSMGKDCPSYSSSQQRRPD